MLALHVFRASYTAVPAPGARLLALRIVVDLPLGLEPGAVAAQRERLARHLRRAAP